MCFVHTVTMQELSIQKETIFSEMKTSRNRLFMHLLEILKLKSTNVFSKKCDYARNSVKKQTIFSEIKIRLRQGRKDFSCTF